MDARGLIGQWCEYAVEEAGTHGTVARVVAVYYRPPFVLPPGSGSRVREEHGGLILVCEGPAGGLIERVAALVRLVSDPAVGPALGAVDWLLREQLAARKDVPRG